MIRLANGQTVWIEVKASFPEYWRKRGQLYRYEHRLFALDEPGLEREASVAKDVRKVGGLSASSADFVGILLVGFDTLSHPMDGDIQKLRDQTGIAMTPWLEASDHWADPYREGQRVHCWFWWRTVFRAGMETA